MNSWIDAVAKIGGLIVGVALAAGGATFTAARLAVGIVDARFEAHVREDDRLRLETEKRLSDLELDRKGFQAAIVDLVALKAVLSGDKKGKR